MSTAALDISRLEGILGLVRRVAACDDVATFRSELADGLGEVIDGDLHYVSDGDATTGELEVVQRPVPLPVEVVAAVLEHRHPIVDRYLETGDGSATRLSDLVTTDEWRSMPIYDVYRPFRVNHQLGATVPCPETRVIGVGVNRASTDFSLADVAVLDRLRPHLVQSVRNAEVRERLADLVDVEVGDDVHGVALVKGDRILEADSAVADTIRDAAGGGPASRLPERVARWADAERRRLDEVDDRTGARVTQPLVEDDRGRRVVLRFVPGDAGEAVVVDRRGPDDAQRLRGFGLTGREAEVLLALTRGTTNDQIARSLGISPHTVRAHLQQIYRKLGVHSRTAAVAIAFEVLGRPPRPG